MNIEKRMNAVLERLGSPLVATRATALDEILLAAFEAIEIRLAGIDEHLQHRKVSDIHRDWDRLSEMAGITPAGNDAPLLQEGAPPMLPIEDDKRS